MFEVSLLKQSPVSFLSYYHDSNAFSFSSVTTLWC